MKPSTEVVKLESELRDLESKIDREKKNKVALVEFDEEKVKGSISEKEREVRQLEDELEKRKKISN